MRPLNLRFGNILVVAPESCAGYGHTRVLRKRADNLFEFNFIETYKRWGAVEARNRIAGIVAEKKIDIVFITFYGDNYLLPLEFLLELKKKARIVLWSLDDESNFDGHSKYYAQAADAVVTTDYFAVAAYRKLGIPAVLCFGNLAKEMYPAADLPRDIDVSFVGNCLKTNRREYMDFLAANGIKVESFGFGSPHDFIPLSDMPKIFRRSKINLNFSRLEFKEAWGGRALVARTTGYKLRVVEVAMTRSFCLSEFFPALPRVFEVGGEIDCFSDPHSLLEKVRYYLENEGERERIADRAHARALREYEDGPYFAKVTAELGAIFSGNPAGLPRAPAVYKSAGFKERQIADLVVHAVSLLVNGRLGACVTIAPELFQYGPWIFLLGLAGGMARDFDILRRKFRDSTANLGRIHRDLPEKRLEPGVTQAVARPILCTACSSPIEGPPRETFREPIFGREFDIFLCGRCGVTFSAIPRDFPLQEWYSKAAHLYSEEAWIIHPAPEKDWRFKYFFSVARELGLRGSLIDIGSGDGRFLLRAGQEGWQGALSGLEGNPDMARRNQGPFKVELGQIEEFVERPDVQLYDVVTIFDVLEHLAEPGRSLGHIARLIRPGGTLIVTVPNADRIRLMEREQFDFPPNHNTRWTARALACLAERNGLEVLKVRVSPFTFQSFSDQLFYKLFPIALFVVKRLLYGRKAGSKRTLTELLAEDAGASGEPLSGCKSKIADKASRRRIEVVLRDAFKVALLPFLVPVALVVCALMPGRKGDCLFLVARKPATRP